MATTGKEPVTTSCNWSLVCTGVVGWAVVSRVANIGGEGIKGGEEWTDEGLSNYAWLTPKYNIRI